MKTGNTEIDTSTAEWVIGSDEAGYGSWAGNLVVAGVAVPRGWSDPLVTDSKAMTDSQREGAVRRYRHVHKWKVVVVQPEEIDRIGVWNALIQSHNSVHEVLSEGVSGSRLHVVDGLTNARSKLSEGLIPLPKADVRVPAVSLASCFAKVVQCRFMEIAEKQHPGYGFIRHRGYHSREHVQALAKNGVTPLHRKSYASIKRYL